jgi:hypothetical protein
MSMTAHEWARQRDACPDAIEWLAEHPAWTMADAWRECHRGDWMFWALKTAGHPVPWDVVDGIADRAVETHALHCGIAEVERWAERWLSGEDRSAAAAGDAWEAAAAGAWAADAAGDAWNTAAWRAAAHAAAAADAAAWRAASSAAATAYAAYAAAVAAAEEADAARDAAVHAAARDARAAESQRQADEIRAAVPRWPGED